MSYYVNSSNDFKIFLDLIGFDTRALTFSMIGICEVTGTDDRRTTLHEIVYYCAQQLENESGNDSFADISPGIIGSQIEYLARQGMIRQAGLKEVEVGGYATKNHKRNLTSWIVTPLGEKYQTLTKRMVNETGELGLAFRDIFSFGRKQKSYYMVSELLMQLYSGSQNLDMFASKFCDGLKISREALSNHLTRLAKHKLINIDKQWKTKLNYWYLMDVSLNSPGLRIAGALNSAYESLVSMNFPKYELEISSLNRQIKKFAGK